MPLKDWFSRRTPLQLALIRGTAKGGNLFDELHRLGDYTVKSKADAAAICRNLSAIERGELTLEGWKAFASLVRLFEEVDGWESPAFDVLRNAGIPILILVAEKAISDSPQFDQDDILTVLKVLAEYAAHDGTDVVIRAAKAGVQSTGYWWQTIFRCYTKDHPETGRLFKALCDPPPPNFIGVSLLDGANAVLIDGGEFSHPFDTLAGKQRLEAWLTDTDEDHFSYAVSAATALPFIGNPDRDRLLAIAFDHPITEVQLEAAWAGAKLGGEAAVKLLARLCLDVNYGETAKRYLVQVEREDAIPDAAEEPAFKAKTALAEWLRHPCELGRALDELEVIDSRFLHWPPDREPKPFWLIKYRARDKTGLKDDDIGVGLVGSITWCFFGYELDQRPPEDCYAIHCYWELEHLKLISDLDVEGASWEFDHLLADCTLPGISDGAIIQVVETDAKLEYPNRLVLLARAKRFGEPGWVVLDDARTLWYAADEMPRDQYEKTLTRIHIGRQLLGLTGETDRRRFLRTAGSKRPPSQTIDAYERTLRQARQINEECWRLSTHLSLLSSAFNDFVDALITTKGLSKHAAVATAYESLLAVGRSAPSAVRKKWLDSWSPVGSELESYTDALIASNRRNEIPALIKEFEVLWDSHMGRSMLATAAFKGGFDEIAAPLLVSLRESNKDWWQNESTGLLARLWYRQGQAKEANSMLVDAMQRLIKQVAETNSSDRKVYEETFQHHRATVLELFGDAGEAYLREQGIPATTFVRPP